MPATSDAAKTASSVTKPVVDGYAPGTVVAVGNQQVEIISFIAEGGFAQIYSVKYIKFLGEFNNGSKAPLQPGDIACLKRVLVPDENGLSEMRNEVEVMKQLRGAKAIIQYYDSNASRRTSGQVGYEVLLLMELCPNNSLLDYMNQRLATRLTEKEILKVMYDTTLAISQMHYLPIPLIHRDIKIENVLVDAQNNFKLCDFGSTSTCFPLVTTHQDIAILTQNIYVNTTPQYRSPEMIDLYRCLPINEKSDIWALGIFLYKLLFFITPFEMTGQFSILHSKYEFPANKYSSKLINLIIIMLAENPYVRPNIYQVMHHICSVIGCEVPIEDKYGLGPYNFEKYTEFQTKLQNVQYQMYLLQQKKLENNGRLNAVEEKLLNDLLITSFEVSSKIPAEVGLHQQQLQQQQQQQPMKSKESVSSSDEFSDHRKSVFSSTKPSRNPSSASRKNLPSNEFENESDANLDAEPKQFASVSMTDRDSHFSPPNQRSMSSYSSGKSLSGGPPIQDVKYSDILAVEQTARSEQSPGIIKQHKSNNPFPMMAQGFGQGQPGPLSSSGTPMGAAPVAPAAPVPQAPGPMPIPGNAGALPGGAGGVNVAPRGTPISIQPELGSRPEYFVDAHSPADDSQFTISQPQPQLPQVGPVPQAQPKMNFNQNMFYQHVDSPVSVQGQAQPIPLKKISDVPQPQSHMRFNYQVPPQQPQSGTSPYYPSPSVGPNASLSAQNPMSQIALQQQPQQQVPRPLPSQQQAKQGFVPAPQHHHQQQQQQQPPVEQVRQLPQHATTVDSSDLVQPPENPPPKPPHPKTWQDYQSHDGLDLKQSLHKRGGSDHRPKTDSPQLERTPSKNLDLSYDEFDLNSNDPPKPISHIKRDTFDSASTVSSTASSESIQIDLDDARRERDRTQQPPASNEKLTQPPEKPIRQTIDSSTGSLRRSLDLKYQEVHFSSPETQRPPTKEATRRQDVADPPRRPHGDIRRHSNNNANSNNDNNNNNSNNNNSNSNNNNNTTNNGTSAGSGSANAGGTSSNAGTNASSGSPPSLQNNDLDRYKNAHKNSSNTSVNASGPASGSGGGEVRRSFAKARQSLDLEKIRKEAVKGEAALSAKRRSIFSVFRGPDKKKE
ncbi:ZYRO0E06864p [Zygosaccharomyces rouxii]|uniref:ZYRO0E06864p n=1 Tax=Zygosaccharomyces rouxii (strain ATCC 2623 / CBS 732 / NBRC 1130 / NCYC 568 / NRRL Y-229) TaxID=559307 RepID=C5E4K5_ZYGRC|nr:uncharacterized protein ZYRO0E06864g [Zygosaccharomyces rouxii]KAH9198178.1 hypothetical protein LQ764DRAFT_154931 [Zygosaccharomyces rouxii]CAR30966.1 ZYRO0E06864p [Zygosaccharomyces rouxii]